MTLVWSAVRTQYIMAALDKDAHSPIKRKENTPAPREREAGARGTNQVTTERAQCQVLK